MTLLRGLGQGGELQLQGGTAELLTVHQLLQELAAVGTAVQLLVPDCDDLAQAGPLSTASPPLRLYNDGITVEMLTKSRN